jgi:hypothetical protein
MSMRASIQPPSAAQATANKASTTPTARPCSQPPRPQTKTTTAASAATPTPTATQCLLSDIAFHDPLLRIIFYRLRLALPYSSIGHIRPTMNAGKPSRAGGAASGKPWAGHSPLHKPV